jgi:hypothetical protein
MKKLGKTPLLVLCFSLLAMALFLTDSPARANGSALVAVQQISSPLPASIPVSVTNPAGRPVLVSDVDNAVRQTVQGFSNCGAEPAPGCSTQLFIVPSGKLLVIETLTASMQVPTGQKALLTLTVQDPAVPKPEFFFLTLEPQGTFTGSSASPSDFFAGTHLVRLYAGAGSTVSFEGKQNGSAGAVEVTVSISGYLVNCGSGSGCPLP